MPREAYSQGFADDWQTGADSGGLIWHSNTSVQGERRVERLSESSRHGSVRICGHGEEEEAAVCF